MSPDDYEPDRREGAAAPEPFAASDLEPPNRWPPTAVGTGASGDEPRRPRLPSHRVIRQSRTVDLLPGLGAILRDALGAVDRGLEQLDPLGDRIADMLRVRRPKP